MENKILTFVLRVIKIIHGWLFNNFEDFLVYASIEELGQEILSTVDVMGLMLFMNI